MASQSLSILSSSAAAYLDICPGAGLGWVRWGSCSGLLVVEFAMAAELFGRKGPMFRG